MKRKRNIPKTRLERWVDLLVWLVILPCLIAVFPVEEWILWRASDVIVYLMWTYLCWYLGRKAVPTMWESGKPWTALAIIFLATVLTYLMSIKPVPFPRDIVADRPPRLYQACLSGKSAIWRISSRRRRRNRTTGPSRKPAPRRRWRERPSP